MTTLAHNREPKIPVRGLKVWARTSKLTDRNKMVNPSLKNGYVQIANQIVEHLTKINIPGQEMRIIWTVLRKTWGWKEGKRRKDWDYISLSQFEKATGMKHGNCVNSIKSVVAKRILLKQENSYKFNQNYDEWLVVKRLPPVVKSIQSSSQTTTKTSSQTTTHKRNIKETIQKKDSASHKFDIGTFPRDWYKQSTDKYQALKGIILKGSEYLPVLKELKLMFKNGRELEQILKAMEICNINYEDWSMNTVRMKIADVVGGKLTAKTPIGQKEPLIVKGTKDI